MRVISQYMAKVKASRCGGFDFGVVMLETPKGGRYEIEMPNSL